MLTQRVANDKGPRPRRSCYAVAAALRAFEGGMRKIILYAGAMALLLVAALPGHARQLVPIVAKKYWIDTDSIAKDGEKTSFHLFLSLPDPPEPQIYYETAVDCATGKVYDSEVVNMDEILANAGRPNSPQIAPRKGWKDSALAAQDLPAIREAVCAPR